jgi:hypothetical protein
MEMEPSRQPRCGRTEAYKHIRRQNQVDLALRELGRIERTLFMLDGLESLELRRGCHAGLSKSEQRHFLAQVICTFKQGRQTRPANKAGKQGRIFDAVPRCQQVRASGLNLVIAAIVFGNSTHIADGDVWASHASGTDCSVARRWAMAVRLRRRFCGGLLFDVLHHMDQHLGRARIGAGGFVDQRLALGNLAARSVRRDEHRLVQCGPEAPESSSWADRGELA